MLEKKLQIHTFSTFYKINVNMNHPFSIMRKTYLRLAIWWVLLFSARFAFFKNINLSIEFTWWLQIKIDKSVDETKITTALDKYLVDKKYEWNKILVESSEWTSTITVKMNVEDDTKVTTLSKDIQDFLIKNDYIKDPSSIIEQSITWPSVWDYMQKTAKNAVVVWLIFMAIYMIFSFMTIRKVINPSVLAVITIVTMIFDISIPAWAYGIWTMINHTIQLDSVFIIAILTTMWYSLNDTIIIFDRIRENLQNKLGQKNISYWKVFEDSLRQTMRRSFWTVFSTFIVIFFMYVLWSWAIKTFAFTIWVWVLAWSYSSIFLSAPLAYLVLGKYKKERKEMKELNFNK